MSARSGALRRRRKRSLATRLRVGWIFITIFAAAAVYGVYALITLPALRVHGIDVRIDGAAVSEREVRAAADIDPDENAWLLNTGAIERRVAAIPYVATARVQRALPAHVTIAVTQREPAACVRGATVTVTIDASRRILQRGCARPDAIAIVQPAAVLGPPGTLAGPPTLTALLTDSAQLAAAHLGVAAIGQDRYGDLVAQREGGVTLLLGGDTDLARKIRLVPAVLAAAPAGRLVRAIDLRAPATPTLLFR